MKLAFQKYAFTRNGTLLYGTRLELYGVVKGVSEALGMQSIAADLGISTHVHIRTDPSAAIGIYLWQDALRAFSFPFCEVRGQLARISNRNSDACSAALVQKADSPCEFLHANGPWYFTLTGYAYLGIEWELVCVKAALQFVTGS